MVSPKNKHVVIFEVMYIFISVDCFLIPKEDFMEDKRTYPARDTRATWLDSRTLDKEPIRNQYRMVDEVEARWFPISRNNGGRVWTPNKRSVGLNTKGSYALLKLQQLDPNQKLNIFKRDTNNEIIDKDHNINLNERASWMNVKRDNQDDQNILTDPNDKKANWRPMKKAVDNEVLARANWRPIKKSTDPQVVVRANWRPMKKSLGNFENNNEIQNLDTRANWRPMKKSEDDKIEEGAKIETRANWRPMKKSQPCVTHSDDTIDTQSSWSPIIKVKQPHQIGTRASWMRQKKETDFSHDIQKRATWVKMRDLGYDSPTESKTQHFINGRSAFAPINAQSHFGYKPDNYYHKSAQGVFYDPLSKYNKDSKFKKSWMDDWKRAMWLPTRDVYGLPRDPISSQVRYIHRRMPTERHIHRRMPTERDLYQRMPTNRDISYRMPTERDVLNPIPTED